MRHLLSLALPTVLLATSALAAPVAVVPGSNASYLYLPASSVNNKVKVTFLKEGGFTDYSITSDPVAVNCGNEETQCTANLVADTTYKFIVDGKYSDALNILPTWSEGCTAAESVDCTTAISGSTLVKINVKSMTNTDTPPVMINGQAKGYFLYQMSDGSFLVAATSAPLASTAWQDPVATANTDADDGRKNMTRIENSAHVTHCLSGLPAALGSGWYWPASNELKAINYAAFYKATSLKEVWSSTEVTGNPQKALKRNMDNGEMKTDGEAKTSTKMSGICVKRF
jgi:hypothetical protein